MIKSFDRLKPGDKSISAENINRLESTVEGVTRSMGADYVDGSGQIMFRKQPVGSFDRAIIMAVVVLAPLRPDPLGTTELEKNGRDFYSLRLYGSVIAEWSGGKAYSVGEQCIKKFTSPSGEIETLFTALLPSTGVSPPSTGSSAFWKKEDEIKIYESIEAPGKDIRFCVPWYVKGDIVPLIEWPELSAKEKANNITTAYRINRTMPYVGEPTKSSIWWNDEENRIMAVF
jgi:hypothetical protein